MSSQPRLAYYAFTTTDGHQATIYVAPDDDPWQVATQYVRAHIASDSHLAALRIASQAESAALTAQLEGAQLEAALPPEPGSGATPPRRDAPTADQPPRGAKVNTSGYGRMPSDHPAWAGRAQQETWRSGVLVIWDHELRRIIGLSAQQALKLLAHLQASEDWRQEGVVLGAPMTRFVLGQPDRPPEPVLSDPIRLSPKYSSSPPGYSAVAPRTAQVLTRLAQASSSVKPRRVYMLVAAHVWSGGSALRPGVAPAR
jgi:hypothetical protein